MTDGRTREFMKRCRRAAAAVLCAAVFAGAAVSASSAGGTARSRAVEYQDGRAALEGYMAYGTDRAERRPGILVAHDWMGLTDKTRKIADRLASLGYTVLAADIYGKGVRPKDAGEAGALAGMYKGDRALLRSRMAAGLAALRADERVDAGRIAVIGYCFGGTAALELARSGADVNGVVSFHGGLDAPVPAKAGDIRARVLVLHGAEDPYAPAEQVRALEEELRAAGADWQLVLYGGAVHSFTDREAGDDPSKGAAYHASADRRSWKAATNFLTEVLGDGSPPSA